MIGRFKYIYEKIVCYTRRFGWRGPILMWRLYALYFRGKAAPVYVRLTRDGEGIWIRPSTDLGIFHQVFVHDEYGFDFEDRVETIVDAGANIGCASVYFALRYPDARIAAIEPMPSTFQMLEKNLERTKRAKALSAAVWPREEHIELVDDSQNHLAVRVQSISEGSNRIRVPGMPIPQVLEAFDLQRIDILKLDIEGAEDDLFATAEDWLGLVRTIVIEFHEDIRPGSRQRILDKIGQAWGQVRVVERGENVLIFPEKDADRIQHEAASLGNPLETGK